MTDKNTVILWWDSDNGQLYQEADIDDPVLALSLGWMRYRVTVPVTLQAADLCVQDGDILEALLKTKQATLVKP